MSIGDEGGQELVQGAERLGLFKAVAAFFRRAAEIGAEDTGKDVSADLEKTSKAISARTSVICRPAEGRYVPRVGTSTIKLNGPSTPTRISAPADGSAHPSDFDLLRHELNESNWMRENGSQSYSAAHQATLDSGFTWNPYAAARDGVGYGAQYQP